MWLTARTLIEKICNVLIVKGSLSHVVWVASAKHIVQGRANSTIEVIMALHETLFRSVLYIPGSKNRALEKARDLPVDAIIFDLEDAVAPDEKSMARSVLANELSAGRYGYRYRMVRINALETEWGIEDAEAVAKMDCDAILLPKVESPKDIDVLRAKAPNLPVWCMIETPRGVLNALAIADHPAVEGFILGTNDLAKDVGCETGGDRAALMSALQVTLMAARAAGIACVDGVFNAFKDDAGFKYECNLGRDLGMDGKTLIHPAQIEIANATFAPSAESIELSTRQIEAYDAAIAKGEAVAVVDGKIVENLHVETARAMLAKADAIRKRDAQ